MLHFIIISNVTKKFLGIKEKHKKNQESNDKIWTTPSQCPHFNLKKKNKEKEGNFQILLLLFSPEFFIFFFFITIKQDLHLHLVC